MSLVSYDYGSNSESEDEDSPNEIGVNLSTPTSLTNDGKTMNISNNSDLPKNEPDLNGIVSSNTDHQIDEPGSSSMLDNGTGIFSSLPQVHAVKTFQEGAIEDFIPKAINVDKGKKKVKITIPSLSQFADEEGEKPAKKIKSMKGSSLLSLLPPVKGTVMTAKSFVPNVVANKNKNATPSTSVQSHNLVPDVIKKKANPRKTARIEKIQENREKTALSDVESDDDIEMPETFDDELWEKVCGRPKPKQIVREPVEESSSQVIDIAPEPEKQYDGLDNRAFKELVGKSKRPIGNIKLIDINEEEMLLDKDLWMVKSLTDPELAPKPEIDEPVDPTRRKKHHITYLVQQAKANEQELQNAWSASRNNKMATRAKYGF
nr:uncharacterized protein LOC111508950 [Leptinotarsa decemlineata]